MAETLNFRRAAERLNVTRPALSKQIKDLEEETGLHLLDRDTVSVELTPAGEVFLNEARRILGDVERAVELAREAQAGRRGVLRIGSVGQIAASFLPGAMRAFRAEFPDVEISFAEMTPVEQLAALGTGDIHLGFAYGRDAERVPGVSSLLLVRSRFGISVSHMHPLARHREAALEDLAGETLLFLGEEATSSHRRDMLRMLAEEGSAAGTLRSISGFESLLNMIAADQGVTMLPEVLDLKASHGIVTLPVPARSADLTFSLWAVWRTEGASPTVRNFVRLLETNRPVEVFQRVS